MMINSSCSTQDDGNDCKILVTLQVCFLYPSPCPCARSKPHFAFGSQVGALFIRPIRPSTPPQIDQFMAQRGAAWTEDDEQEVKQSLHQKEAITAQMIGIISARLNSLQTTGLQGLKQLACCLAEGSQTHSNDYLLTQRTTVSTGSSATCGSTRTTAPKWSLRSWTHWKAEAPQPPKAEPPRPLHWRATKPCWSGCLVQTRRLEPTR